MTANGQYRQTTRGSVSLDTIIAEFKAAMLRAGIEPPEHVRVDTPRLIRFKVAGSKDRSGYYRRHTDGIPAGVFGCWRLGIRETWCFPREQRLARGRVESMEVV